MLSTVTKLDSKIVLENQWNKPDFAILLRRSFSQIAEGDWRPRDECLTTHNRTSVP